MRYAARVDANQQAIVKALRQAGRSVVSLHREGKGIPDLLVGYHRMNFVLEIKTEKGTLTEDQVSFIDNFRGTVYIVRDIDEALKVTEC